MNDPTSPSIDLNPLVKMEHGLQAKALPPYEQPLKDRPCRKVFATPFRLVFKNTESDAVTWIKVESLDGLKTVIERVASGKLMPVNAVATLDRQLWGLLAEHVGFLRHAGPTSGFSAGIQPAGADVSELAEDMSTLFGGFEGALEGLSSMRNAVIKKMTPVDTNSLLKEDGVNLTEEGEDFLEELVDATESEPETGEKS